MEIPFQEYAEKIWENDPHIAKDHLRWHTSGYHISDKSISIEDAVEDAFECLDIIPDECKIPVELNEWHNDYFDNPKMISAMASTLYSKLKTFNKYSFDEEPNWEDIAEKYLH